MDDLLEATPSPIATVVAFPMAARSCELCVHHGTDSGLTVTCSLIGGEQIWFPEDAARDCESYERE